MYFALEGMAELQKTLRTLPDATAKRILGKTLQKAAIPVAQRARALAPRRTGKLRLSVHISKKLSKRQARMRRKHDPSDVEIFVGTGPLKYAHLVEYGTRKMSAKPFMRPAWDGEKMAAFDVIASELRLSIEKAVRRHAKKRAAGR